MSTEENPLLERVRGLRTHRQGNRRTPHKPLLMLFAIAKLRRGERSNPFEEVQKALVPLLLRYAPPTNGRPRAELPYWHLTSDGLWTVDDADALERRAGGFPTMKALRQSAGGFPMDIADELSGDDRLASAVVRLLLDEHFAPSTHADIAKAVGLEIDAEMTSPEGPPYGRESRRRDPGFRERILRAYEHRCAFGGFRAALTGSFFGCEAAHVRWHSYGGGEDLSNGIALEPTVHRLFDVGVWSLTDDLRIIVSSHFTGTDEAVERVRGRHGKRLRLPLPGDATPNPENIRWHREPSLGGVFRSPALPL